MTVNTTVIKDQYNCNGILTSLAFTFKVWQTSEVKVILRDSTGAETVLTETVDYTVSLTGDVPSAGSITTVATYAAGNTLTLKEIIPGTQLVDWGEGDRFPADSHEEAADRAAIRHQQQDEKISRALLLPESTALSDLAFPEPSALKYPRWDAAGAALENAELAAFGDLTAHIADTSYPHAAWEAVVPLCKNMIINGGMNVFQRAANADLSAVAALNYLFGPDRFEACWQGTACTSGIWSTQLNASFDSGWAGSLNNLTLTGAGAVYVRHRMESKDARQLYNAAGTKLSSLSFKCYQDTGADVTVTAYLYGANALDNFAATTALTSASASIPTGVVTEVTMEGLSLADCRNGVEILFHFATGAITLKNVLIGDIQLERNARATDIERRPFAQELAMCQRYYQKNYDYAVAPGTAVNASQDMWACSLLANSASVIFAKVPLKPAMRTAPTVTLYDNAGSAGKVNCIVANVAGTASEIVTEGFWVNATMSAANTSKQLSFFYVADAEF